MVDCDGILRPTSRRCDSCFAISFCRPSVRLRCRQCRRVSASFRSNNKKLVRPSSLSQTTALQQYAPLDTSDYFEDPITFDPEFSPELPLPQSLAFLFIVVTFALLRLKMKKIANSYKIYEEKEEEFRQAKLLLYNSEASGDRIKELGAAAERAKLDWENSKEVIPGVNVITRGGPKSAVEREKRESNNVAKSNDNGEGDDKRITDPFMVTILFVVGAVLTSTLLLLSQDPMKDPFNGIL